MNALRARPLALSAHKALCSRRLLTFARVPLARFQSTSSASSDKLIYQSPTEQPVKILKMFCVFGTGTTLLASPLLLMVDAPLPMVARVSGIGMALFGTASTAAFVSKFFSGYVLSVHREANEGPLVFRTADLFLRTRRTSVYDPSFIVRSTRPSAKFELARRVEGTQGGQPGTEETVAETTDATGKVLGRWVVRWKEGGVGECRAEGNIVQELQLAEELLAEPLSPALSPPPSSST